MKIKTTRRMMMLLALVLVVSIVGVACGNKTNNANAGNAGSTTTEPTELSLGLLPSIDEIPFVIAHEQGFDQKHGVKLNIQTFKSAKDRDVAFQAGKVEGLSADLVAISIYNEAGLDVKITSTTFGEFDLFTGNKEIQDVKDLKGKSVILSKNTSTQYTVAMMLKQAGLTEKDINITEVPQIPTRLELLKNNKADAAILPEPFVTMGKTSGLRVLSSTKQAQVNPFVLAFPQSVIEAKPEAIRAMYAAYDDAVAYMKSHDQKDYIDLVIKEVGYPENLKDQIVVPAYIPANQVDVKEVESAFAWAREQGLLTKNITPEDVISNVQFKK
ncbi:MetQ/NlpA family ABC transporter substrate-binding protein [Paenibacillus sp. D2_2]|uniref:ABC transporter substrate-binding protein n=1 Tax=Paenibacillus sp. D2_2 TaxID=3073092 RepID=UPI002815D1D1|nr:MetQ/NlpA family ABC transporter substrate-binding protein [Paenibacillus sp. D2_2]WMT39654.1 MetQ/NlpA family ABC transporter substrate-binding protein [Paenibacillus sp. D2_2]